jgi:hypothetical protein
VSVRIRRVSQGYPSVEIVVDVVVERGHGTAHWEYGFGDRVRVPQKDVHMRDPQGAQMRCKIIRPQINQEIE